MRPALTRITAAALSAPCAALICLATPAHAQDNVNPIAGDGGLVERTCGTTREQVRVDSTSVAGMSACFTLTAPTGWVAVNITGSYGVVNNLTTPISVAFKLPNGAVYFQQVIQPGQVKSVDVDRRGSTIVELQVTPVTTPNGASTATLTPSRQTPNYVTFRSAGRINPGQVMRLSWSGVKLSPLDRNSGFNDRLDASFKVVPALDSSQCISLESAAYPGTYLTMNTNGTVAALTNPDTRAATWCPTAAETTPTGVFLANATNQTRILTADANATVTTATNRTTESVWFTDQALALPGK